MIKRQSSEALFAFVGKMILFIPRMIYRTLVAGSNYYKEYKSKIEQSEFNLIFGDWKLYENTDPYSNKFCHKDYIAELRIIRELAKDNTAKILKRKFIVSSVIALFSFICEKLSELFILSILASPIIAILWIVFSKAIYVNIEFGFR